MALVSSSKYETLNYTSRQTQTKHYTQSTNETYIHTCWCAQNSVTLVAWVARADCFATGLTVCASSMNITNVNLQTGYIYKQQNATVTGYIYTTATVMEAVMMITEYSVA